MQITEALLDHLAALSKLRIPSEEKANLMRDFQGMLDFVDQLQEVDTEGVAPLIHMTEEINHLRKDEASGALPAKEMIQQAPDNDGTFFRVPKVVRK
ncbi:MAG: Asp-tRNA(Asn)/Glu-tRNA(Gln) amidotransferase subunit GatC [Bacteroidota bacterium]